MGLAVVFVRLGIFYRVGHHLIMVKTGAQDLADPGAISLVCTSIRSRSAQN